MRYIFWFLSLNIIHGSTLPVEEQFTVSACTDISTGSHGCSVNAREEHYQKVQIMMGEMFFNMKQIGGRFEAADEAEKKLAKEHYHDFVNVCKNLSAKIDALGETASGADIDKDLEQVYQNLSLRIEKIIDEKLLSVIASIQSRIINAEESIKERIQSHDLSLQRLDQNISTEVDRIDGRLQSLVQQVGEIYQLLKKTDCPDGFDYVHEINQCLYLNLEPMTWDNARNACASFKTGAQMVSIKDSAKQAAVRKYLQLQFTKLGPADCFHSYWRAKIAWISGQRQNPNRCNTSFSWKDNRGSGIPFNFTKWANGQPDCHSNAEHCVHIMSAFDYSWNDASCILSLCSVCEI